VTLYGRAVKQEVRFCTASDGVRLGYAVHGRGPPLVRVATWLTHLGSDRDSPVWSHWLARLGERNTVVRYDERGCGLSAGDVGRPTLDAWVGDLEAVVEASGVERFALLGISQGAAIAIAYAARNPERVTDLVLYGGYARGRKLRGQATEEHALLASIQAGWDSPQPTFRRTFSMLFLPDGTTEQMQWFEDLLRSTTSPENAASLIDARGDLDVTALAPQVRARTLVLHCRGDRVVPVEEGLLLASLVPGARLTLLDSPNHILLEEPAWEECVAELHGFLRPRVAAPHVGVAELSPRELEVLELVAEGLTNAAVAERLCLSVRTVERHLANIYAKLRVSGKAGRAAAAARFAEHGALAHD
jgi:pimeloyl-ACP methyl ester carboxylesterase/DNA-binding CsgD family transcriptional regulator